MRKVYAGLFSSIDGVVGGPNEWQPSFDAEMGAALSRMLDEQDAVLRSALASNDQRFGRKSAGGRSLLGWMP
jgi:hypothetical protein